jgi:hypothetical protein
MVPSDIKLVSLSTKMCRLEPERDGRKGRKMLSDENRAGIKAEMKWSSWAPILVLIALIAMFVVFERPSGLANPSGAATPTNGRSAR